MTRFILLLFIALVPEVSAQFCDPEAKRIADSLDYQVNMTYSHTAFYDFEFVIFNHECFNGSRLGVRLYFDVEEKTVSSVLGQGRNKIQAIIYEDCTLVFSGLEEDCNSARVVSGVYDVIGRLDMSHGGPGGTLGKLYIIKLMR